MTGMVGRLTVVEQAINKAPPEGLDVAGIAAHTGFTDGGGRQVAPLAWWLAHTGRAEMSRDCTRFRPAPTNRTCPSCGTATKPVNGHRALCFDCTLDELGESWEQIHERSAAVARKAAQRTFQGKAR